MSPAANQDPKLLSLQLAVAEARAVHEDLVERHRVVRTAQYKAAAAALQPKVKRAYEALQKASKELAAYISKKQRSMP